MKRPGLPLSGRWRSVARRRSGVDGASARVDEPPVVAGGVKRELEDAERLGRLLDVVGAVEREEILDAGADDELPDSPARVHVAGGVLGREPAVAVQVAGQDDVRPGVVEGLPEILVAAD